MYFGSLLKPYTLLVLLDEEGWGIKVYANCVEPSSDATDFFTVWNSEENAQQAINQVGEGSIIAAVKHFGRV